MQWYYARGDEQVGPLDEQEFQELVNARIIASETMVWRPGMPDWQPYGEYLAGAAGEPLPGAAPVFGAEEYAAGEEQRACASCGRVLPASEMLEYQGDYVCAACKPAYFQAVREGAPLVAGLRYAGFWIRVLATIVDGVLLNIVYFTLGLIFGFLLFSQFLEEEPNEALISGLIVALYVTQYALVIAYETFFIGRFGATPGKMLCKIRVVRPDGSRVTYLRAFARFFATILSALIFLIGFIMVAFDSEKRGLHDYICDTRVIQ